MAQNSAMADRSAAKLMQRSVARAQCSQQVEAITAVHSGSISSNEIKSHTGQDRRVIVPLAAALSDLPEDTPNTMSLRRAAFKVLGRTDQMYREYTDCELRQCLKSVTLGTMNQAEAREQYGPSEKTQDTYAKSIGAHFGLEPPKIFRQLRVFAETNGDAVGHFIDSMEIGKSGRQAEPPPNTPSTRRPMLLMRIGTPTP